jgi:hypothetical protein
MTEADRTQDRIGRGVLGSGNNGLDHRRAFLAGRTISPAGMLMKTVTA